MRTLALFVGIVGISATLFASRDQCGSEVVASGVTMQTLPRVIQEVTDIKTLLILVAMGAEEEALLSGMEGVTTRNFHDVYARNVKEITVGDHRILIAQSGVGLVSGALIAAFVAERTPVDAILLLGVGGSLDNRLQIGDAVVAERVLQHDCINSTDAGNELMAPGELHLSLAPEARPSPELPIHPVLLGWLKQMNLPGPHKLYTGTVASGSEFVGTAQRKRAIGQLPGSPLLVDMEAAGVALVAKRSGIAFGMVKTVADRYDADGTIHSDYMKFMRLAASNASLLFRQLLTAFRKP